MRVANDQLRMFCQPVEKVEEEELSEMQLRLLALQSASKKWQQKEQQVLKKSKDRITKVAQEKRSAVAVPPSSRQRVATRSTTSAAAAERNRTRSKPGERDRDRTKAGPRASDIDRPKQSPKPGPKPALERSCATRKPYMTKKMVSPGEPAGRAWKCRELHSAHASQCLPNVVQ